MNTGNLGRGVFRISSHDQCMPQVAHSPVWLYGMGSMHKGGGLSQVGGTVVFSFVLLGVVAHTARWG